MRWDRSIGRGMQLIYSLASVEHEAGEWSAIECIVDTDNDGHRGVCGKCQNCRANEDMGKALSYLGKIIDKHSLGTDED